MLLVSATFIAEHNYSNCDLQLRLKASKVSDANESGNNKQNAPTLALFRRGLKWESHLNDILATHNRILDFKSVSSDTLVSQIVSDARPDFYIVNLTLQPPETLFQTPLRSVKPDFIHVVKVENEITLTVIDAKISASLKSAHQLQISIYAAVLSDTILKQNVPLGLKFHVSDVGIVWFPPPPTQSRTSQLPTTLAQLQTMSQTQASRFSISLVTPILSDLLNKRIPKILSADLEAVEWGLGGRCKGCEFEEGCKARVRVTGRDLRNCSSVIGNSGKNISGKVAGALNCCVDIAGAILEQHGTSEEDHLEIKLQDPPLRISSLNWNHFWQLKQKCAPKPGASEAKLIRTVLSTHSTEFWTKMQAENASATKLAKTILSVDESGCTSPVLESILNHTVEPLLKPCVNFPASEEIAYHISILRDPEFDIVVGVCLLCKQKNILEAFTQPGPEFHAMELPGSQVSWKFIELLASQITNCAESKPPKRVQFYVYTPQDREALLDMILEHLNNPAVTPVMMKSAEKCAIALIDQPNVLLAPVFPPQTASKVTLIGKELPALKADIQWFLNALEGGRDGIRNEKVTKLEERIKQILYGDDYDNYRISMLPRIVAVQDAIKDTLSVPVIGRLCLERCARIVNSITVEVPTEEILYAAYQIGDEKLVMDGLKKRVLSAAEICDSIRLRIKSSGIRLDQVLVNQAEWFKVLVLDLCKDATLSRLIFQTQFEMIREYQMIKNDRHMLENYCELEYEGAGGVPYSERFKIISGHSLLHSNASVHNDESDFKIFEWILVDANTTAATRFNDLLHFSQYVSVSVSRTTLELDKNEAQDIGASLAFAHVLNTCSDNANSVEIEVRGSGFKFVGPVDKKPQTFYLFKRFKDFNTHKVVKGLFEVEITRLKRIALSEPPPIFLRLFSPEASAIENHSSLEVASKIEDLKDEKELYTVYKTIYELESRGEKLARPLHFMNSQHSAAKHATKNCVTIVWGPPGNGKTHTLALTALRLIEINARLGRKFHIIMTAVTHAAICTFKAKALELIQHRKDRLFSRINGPDWVHQLKIFDLKTINPKTFALSCNWSVSVGTVWKIWKLFENTPTLKGAFDMLIIDEGSQFLVSHGAIALHSIDTPDIAQKRLVIAGDSMQLGPILKGKYPGLESTESRRPLYGSILDSLLFQNSAITFMLKENFRFVTGLCKFAQQLYIAGGNNDFEPHHGNQTMVSSAIQSWQKINSGDNDALGILVHGFKNNPLAVVFVDEPNAAFSKQARSDSFEMHIERESLLVSSLVKFFNQLVPKARVFVITPHKLQRSNLINLLHRSSETKRGGGTSDATIRIDTVERMQGDQADIVIACYGFTSHTATFESELEFIYDIHRINVALSRAKALCVLVASQNLFHPPGHVLNSKDSRDGLNHLQRFRAKSTVQIWKPEEDMSASMLKLRL